jgi:hypothetical protein
VSKPWHWHGSGRGRAQVLSARERAQAQRSISILSVIKSWHHTTLNTKKHTEKKFECQKRAQATATEHLFPMRLALPTPPSRSITLPPDALCYYISGIRICGGWRGQVHYLALGEIPGGPSGADQAVRVTIFRGSRGGNAQKQAPISSLPQGVTPWSGSLCSPVN